MRQVPSAAARDGLALIALGANLPSAAGNPEETLRAALATLGCERLQLRAVSRFFRTPAFPAGAGPDYVNAAAALATDMTPQALLARLHEREAAFGRLRETRWGQRTLDLDLVGMGGLILPDPATWRAWAELSPADQVRRAPERLVLPHPRLQDRAFVLIPLHDIAPLWHHPVTGLSVAEMAAVLPEAEKSAVRPL